jgi:hypothetical protein
MATEFDYDFVASPDVFAFRLRFVVVEMLS